MPRRLHFRIALALTPLVACGGDSSPTAPPPHVVLISLDTVRADELSVYGADPGATPGLDAFAETSTRYAEAIASAPWTMPTHASIFTGLYPFEHGAQTYLPGPENRGDNVFALDPRFETLAESLAGLGYRTGGVVANSVYLREGLGLEEGFATWDVRREAGERVTERALAWLDQGTGGDRPLFLFVNYMDAHRPYATGDPTLDARGELDKLIERVMDRGEAPGERGVRVAELHQRAVSRLDREVAAFLAGLAERNLFDEALIIVTSDHGEAFGAHGVVEHSKDVYQELVRVPLLVKEPGQTEGAVATARASSSDIPGIVARALAARGYDELRGVYPRLPGTHPVLVENRYSRVGDLRRFGERFRRRRYALFDGRWKLVAGSDGSIELYDLDVDPDEASDVAPQHADRVEAMLRELEELLEATKYEGRPPFPGELTQQQRRDMGELGYGGPR